MKRIVIFVVMFAAGVPLYAQSGEHPVMARVRKNYGGEGTLHAAFDQSIYWDVREREEKKSGEIQVASGNRFRVTLGRETFVSDGKTYWQYNERNSQVVIRRAEDIDASTLPTRILSTFLTNRQFVEIKRGGGTIEFLWDGKGKDAQGDGYTKIGAVIDENTAVIRTLKLTDKNNNIHTYTFKRTAFDRVPKNDVFKFTVPRGVEVLDMRDP